MKNMNNGGGKTERFLFCSLRLSVFAVLFAQCCSSEEVCDAIPNAFGNATKYNCRAHKIKYPGLKSQGIFYLLDRLLNHYRSVIRNIFFCVGKLYKIYSFLVIAYRYC
jgi:hypothetical protein